MHSHDHSHSEHSSTANLRFVFFLNLFFTLLEIVGGFFTNSLAIMADAVHDLGDTIALGLAWTLEHVAKKPRTDRFSYGYKRFSLLGAFINCLVLIVASVVIVYHAVPRILHPEPTHAPWMLVFALLGIAVNSLGIVRLQHAKTMNEQIVTWHFIEDVLGWIAVLVASILIMITGYTVIDPILSILVTLYVLYNVAKNLIKTVVIFLQGVPLSVDFETLKGQFIKLEGLKAIHDGHIWTLDGSHHILTLHAVVDAALSHDAIIELKCRIRDIAHQAHIEHITVEIEQERENCFYKE